MEQCDTLIEARWCVPVDPADVVLEGRAVGVGVVHCPHSNLKLASGLARIRSQPVYNPASQVVYTATPDQVSDVRVAGRQLLERGHLAAADEEEILQRSSEWQKSIAAR